MNKLQRYYFEDFKFQLEVNLLYIRRELVHLLETHQFNDCFECNRLKCCCFEDQSSLQSTTLSIDSSYCELHDISMGSFYSAAPPADTLPTPEWIASSTGNVSCDTDEDSEPIAAINAWVRASIPNIVQSNTRLYFPVPKKILDQINYTWPPFPKSIWSKEKLKETLEMEKKFHSERVGNDSVADFFNYFGEHAPVLKSAVQ